ncbi:hypothetical protein DB88DRAFT_23686 [Papiliotrema laurentii]|uniref:Uncharacterized protein n=1 Tax=Papiliotrema laurentii TaxID=5418 RepID=A0AAD9FWG9_PAPLA|nr:hypothetical protein DB88DRAFT_23686 [Papiliotrema laurentii]
MATKAKISNRANVRNRAVRRLKTAVDLVVNRGVSLDVEENGWDLVSNEFMYMATVEKSILDVPMEVLCDEVAALLRNLRRKGQGVVARRPGPPSRIRSPDINRAGRCERICVGE